MTITLRAMGEVKYVTPGGWFQVERMRYGYQLVHRGTDKILPHLGYCRAPEGGWMVRTLIRYLADAKAFAREVEDFDNGALCTDDMPPSDKLQALKAHLEASPCVDPKEVVQ